MAGTDYYPPKDSDLSDLENDEKQARIRFKPLSTHEATTDGRGRQNTSRRLSRGSSVSKNRRSLSASNAGFPLQFRTLSIAVSESQQRPDETDNKRDRLDITERDYFTSLHFHTSDRNQVLSSFSVSEKHGLSDEVAAARLLSDGRNTLPKVRESYHSKLFWYLFGGFCSVLWFAVIVFFLCWRSLSSPPSIANLAMAILVIFVILLQASFSAFQDWSTKRVMNSILDLLPTEAMVTRNGTSSKVSATELVAGDIVQISIGNKVPADLLLLSTSGDIRFDRSVLTGEPDEIEGSIDSTSESFLETRNIALMGTNVTNGNGVGVVVLTGMNSVMGRIAKVTTGVKANPTLIQQGKSSQSNIFCYALKSRRSSFCEILSGQAKLTIIPTEISRFIRIIVVLTICLALLILLAWVSWLRIDHPGFLSVVAMLNNVLGTIVAFIPEGLPIGVALTLMMIARQMKAANILPKGLSYR